jgi:hypothetical protein
MSDYYDENGNLLVPDNDRKSDPGAPVDPIAEAELEGARFAEPVSLYKLPSKDAHFEDQAADMSENELQAGTGQVCPVCHRAIEAGEPVPGGLTGHTSTTLADRDSAALVV